MRTGWVNVNESSNYWETHLPFGGRAGSASGIGRVGGSAPIETFTELQTVVTGMTLGLRHRRRRLRRLRPRGAADRGRVDPGARARGRAAATTCWDPFIHMPAALSFPIGNPRYDWMYRSEPEPFMHGRRVYHARGKVLGGSSSINGMIFQRGNPLDYERWASEAGLETWDYAHCLPYFKKMETCLAGADDWRGGDGPIVLERGPAVLPALRGVLRGRAAGRLRADRRRQRLPAGGLRRVRPHDPPRAAA